MGYCRKWKPSKAAKNEFKEEMSKIEEFCIKNNIYRTFNNNSYYFNLNGVDYRVSNHTIDVSNCGAYNEFGEKTREFYHDKEEAKNTVCILAGKTRIIEIYNDLRDGYQLDKRGRRISGKEEK